MDASLCTSCMSKVLAADRALSSYLALKRLSSSLLGHSFFLGLFPGVELLFGVHTIGYSIGISKNLRTTSETSEADT